MIGNFDSKAFDLSNNEFVHMLHQLFAGNQSTFHQYLVKNNVTKLDLRLNFTVTLDFEQLKSIFDSLVGTPIKIISLASNILETKNIAELIRLLNASNVHTIDLAATFPSDEKGVDGKIELAQAIVESPIRSVDFSFNELNAANSIDLINTLKQKAYKKLVFQDCSASVSFIHLLSGLRVECLSLRRSHLGDESAKALAHWLKKSPLQVLDLLMNSEMTEIGAIALEKALPYSQMKRLLILQCHETHKLILAVNELSKQRAIASYYHAIYPMLHVQMPKSSVKQGTRENELKNGVSLMFRVPPDVRRIIEDYAANGKANRYQQIRQHFHPAKELSAKKRP